jgi:hypothetical protein
MYCVSSSLLMSFHVILHDVVPVLRTINHIISLNVSLAYFATYYLIIIMQLSRSINLNVESHKIAEHCSCPFTTLSFALI